MAEPKKVRRASDEQKEYLLAYMEEHIEFAHDRFESSDGAHLKASKWQMLATNLNALGGAWKGVNQWRKYWRDQKLHAKEREALIKASFQRSGVNGSKKTKELTPYEERIVALLAPAAISGAVVPEVFNLPQVTTTAATGQASEAIRTPEDGVNIIEIVEASDLGFGFTAEEIPVTVVAGPSSAAAMRPTRKRKRAPSGKTPEVSSFQEKLIQIEEEKLRYVMKSYEVQKKTFIWKQKYEGRLLELKERKLCLQEKELEFKMKNIK